MQWRQGTFEVDSDPGRIDFERLYSYLSTTYWASDRSFNAVRRIWEASSPVFGVYAQQEGAALVGCARVVTDTYSFAWLGDVFIDERLRGQGLGQFLMDCILQHPDCGDVQQFILATRDAHGLYKKFGWTPLAEPDRYMIRRRPTAE